MRKNIYVVGASIVIILVVWLVIHSVMQKKDVTSGEAGGASLQTLYNEAKVFESKGSYLDAQARYRDILDRAHNEELIKRVQEDLKGLDMKILFSPILTEDSISYTVKQGDTLGKISKKFNTTVGLLMRSNNLKSDVIRIGQKLKVSQALYSVIVDNSENTLTLKSDNKILKIYEVATGINNETPIGTFTIINKLKDPVWYKTGAIVPSGSDENILGSRWMGLSENGYGIHGTTEPETIGQHVTAGCVRMREPDVQELYDILPDGTEVVINE